MLLCIKGVLPLLKDDPFKQRVTDCLLDRQGAAADSELHRLLVELTTSAFDVSKLGQLNAVLDAHDGAVNPDILDMLTRVHPRLFVLPLSDTDLCIADTFVVHLARHVKTDDEVAKWKQMLAPMAAIVQSPLGDKNSDSIELIAKHLSLLLEIMSTPASNIEASIIKVLGEEAGQVFVTDIARPFVQKRSSWLRDQIAWMVNEDHKSLKLSMM